MGEKLFFFHVGAFYIINKNKKIRRKSAHAMPKIKHNFPHDAKMESQTRTSIFVLPYNKYFSSMFFLFIFGFNVLKNVHAFSSPAFVVSVAVKPGKTQTSNQLASS